MHGFHLNLVVLAIMGYDYRQKVSIINLKDWELFQVINP